MVGLLLYHSGSSVQEPAADRAMEALWGRGLLDAVAAAALGVVATGQRELHELTTTTALTENDLCDCLEVVGDTALAVNTYILLLAEYVCRSLTDLCVGGRFPAQLQLPPEAVRALEALGDSQLLAAAATSLVDSPAVSTLPRVNARMCNRVLYLVQIGCKHAGNALFCMQNVQRVLYGAGGPEAQRLGCGLLRAMRHVAVQRLQVALLDQLAAHAGLGAALPEEGRLDKAGEQQQDGSSGAWWFARQEAQWGRLLGLHPAGREEGRRGGHQASSDRTGLLEEAHCHTVFGALGTWGGGVEEQAAVAAAGVPAGPPPLLVAQLAARAAEALCRLCRGQGLEGAYAPAPEWQLAMSQVCRPSLQHCGLSAQRTRLPPLPLQQQLVVWHNWCSRSPCFARCILHRWLVCLMCCCCSGLQDVVRALVPSEYWDSLPAATARACVPQLAGDCRVAGGADVGRNGGGHGPPARSPAP